MFAEKVAKKRALIAKHSEQLKKMLKECPHEEWEDKSYYFEGSYLDTAYTEYWRECKCCGEKTIKRTKNHGWYG